MASTGGRQDRGTSAVARLCSTISVAAAITLGAWWEGTQRQSSRSAHISIGITIAVVFVGALSLGRHRQHAATRPWLAGAWSAIGSWRRQPKAAVVAVCIWVALGSAVVGWDLVSFLAQSHDLPTASYFIGRVTRSHGGRAACVLVWVLTGAALAGGRRELRR